MAKYDPTTDIGQVRMWLGDTDSTNFRWKDVELQVFLTLCTQKTVTNVLFINHRLAAASALRAEASSAARLAKIVKLGTLGINKQTVFQSLLQAAEALEKDSPSLPSLNPPDQVFGLDYRGLVPPSFGTMTIGPDETW